MAAIIPSQLPVATEITDDDFLIGNDGNAVAGSKTRRFSRDVLASFVEEVVAPGLGEKAPAAFTQSGTGAILRTVDAKLKDVVSVKDFGATGNGSTDDTAAILLAIAYAQTLTFKRLYFPRGSYKISGILTITGDQWDIHGDGFGCTSINSSFDGDIFRVDISSSDANLGAFRDLEIRYYAIGATDSTGIHFYKSGATTLYGASHWHFTNLLFRSCYRGIRFCKPKQNDWGGVDSISNYFSFIFDNIRTATLFQALYEVVSFDAGPGNHHTWLGGVYQASHACIKMGDGGATTGVGDQLITGGAHFLSAQYGVKILGPSDLSIYRENITISGCQFDGITVATVQAERLKNFRIKGNNSTSAADVVLVDCDSHATENNRAISGSYGIKQKSIPAGSQSGYLFDIKRSPPGIAVWQAHYVEVALSYLIAGVGLGTHIWRGFVNFSSAAGCTATALENVSTNNSTYITFSVAASGLDAIRFSYTTTSTPSGVLIDGQVRVLGKNYAYAVAP